MFTNEVTSMEQHGFIQDMLDVKVLILFVMVTRHGFTSDSFSFLFAGIAI